MARPKKRVFTARPGSPYPKERAQAVGEFLDRLSKERGLTEFRLLSPEMVVEASEYADSPLYDIFEWDNDEAGPLWRRHQARNVVRSTQVRVIRAGEEKYVPAFFNVSTTSEDGERTQGYASGRAVDASEMLKAQIAAKLINEVENMQRRYQDFADCFDVALAMLRKRA